MQEIPVALQGYYFVITLTLGAAVGVLFDFYRTCRYFRRPRRHWVFIWDLVFFLVVTVLVYAGLLLANWGEVRVYVFVGLTLGLTLYYLLFSPTVLRFFRFLLRVFLTGLGALHKGLRAIGLLVVSLVSIPLRPFLILGRFIKKKLVRRRVSLQRAGGRALKRAKKYANIFSKKKS